jgi:hypothetical protein
LWKHRHPHQCESRHRPESQQAHGSNQPHLGNLANNVNLVRNIRRASSASDHRKTVAHLRINATSVGRNAPAIHAISVVGSKCRKADRPHPAK